MEESMPRKKMFRPVLYGVCALTVALAACKAPPTKEEMASVDYGPRPDDYEQIVRDYFKTRLADPASAVIEFKAGPKMLYQQGTLLRNGDWGWGVCVEVREKTPERGYGRAYPMAFYLRNGKVETVNGGNDDSLIGGRFARDACKKLGYEFH
jgi:hypothetical protein